MCPKPRRGEERFLRGEEVIQEDSVHLYRSFSPWEGGEARLRTSVGEPLGRPKALRGSGQQKGGPVFVLGGFNCLKVPRLGGAGKFPHVRGVVFPGRSGSLGVLTTEDSQVGGPPGFGVVGRSGYWRVLFEQSH